MHPVLEEQTRQVVRDLQKKLFTSHRSPQTYARYLASWHQFEETQWEGWVLEKWTEIYSQDIRLLFPTLPYLLPTPILPPPRSFFKPPMTCSLHHLVCSGMTCIGHWHVHAASGHLCLQSHKCTMVVCLVQHCTITYKQEICQDKHPIILGCSMMKQSCI